MEVKVSAVIANRRYWSTVPETSNRSEVTAVTLVNAIRSDQMALSGESWIFKVPEVPEKAVT